MHSNKTPTEIMVSITCTAHTKLNATSTYTHQTKGLYRKK